MDFKKDYYRILGIRRESPYEEVKAAYRRLAKQYHPDLHPGDTACEGQIKEINEAWEVLGNSDSRFVYDTFKTSEFQEQKSKDEPFVKMAQTPPKPKERTYTKKQWVAHEKRFYICGEVQIKYRGRQDDNLTADVLKEVFYNLQTTDVRTRVLEQDIHREKMPESFRSIFAGPQISLKVPMPVRSTVISSHGENHYLLDIRDFTVPLIDIRDVTKDDGDSFGTLIGMFYGYISVTTYTEEETLVTEMFGETGKKETKTEQNQHVERKEFYHADGRTYWSNWTRAPVRNTAKTTKPFTTYQPAKADTGCFKGGAGCVPYLLWTFFLILLLPKLLLLWPLVLFFLLLWLVSVRRWTGIFRLVSLLSVLFFLFSLYGVFRRTPDKTNSVVKEKPAETRLVKKPLPGGKDTLITRFRSWKDYDGKLYEGWYTLRQSGLSLAARFKQDMNVAGNGEQGYDEMLQKLSYNDHDQLGGLYHLLNRIRDKEQLGRTKFAEMFLSMVQDIPYAVVLPLACDSGLYHDRFISSYLARADAKCDANQRFGINSPVEFLAGLNGDCDTRTLLVYTVLAHYGYHVALFSSGQYSHSLIGVDLPYEGTAYQSPDGRFVLWETTSRTPPGLLPNDINNLDYWRISLISKR